MNNISNPETKRPCTSCGVCAVICPQDCISIQLNDDGFFRPSVDESACISCSMCVQVCPKYMELPATTPFYLSKEVYSENSTNINNLKNASSGGLIPEIYQWGIKNDYYVSGVEYDYSLNGVKHTITNNPADIETIASSKYLQSYTVDAFKELSADKKYIIVGSPCQIAGLRKYAEKKRIAENLILIDFFCAGVPSYNLWTKYLDHLKQKHSVSEIKSVKFRSKKQSDWHTYGMDIESKSHDYYMDHASKNDLFFRFFLSDTCKNDSCCKNGCPFRKEYSYADLRVGDFWGDEYSTDKQGVSAVIVNSEKGKALLNSVNNAVSLEQKPSNSIIQGELKDFHAQRQRVLSLLREDKSLVEIEKLIFRKSMLRRVKNKLHEIINRK